MSAEEMSLGEYVAQAVINRKTDAIPDGQAYVQSVGWETKDDMKQFRAVLVFPNGPPDFPFSMVWDRTPVTIVLGGS